MENNKEKKENKSLWTKIRNAGYGFIPMVIVSIICIGWMHYCEGGYYLVKKDHCVAIDDSILKFSCNVSIIQDSDSIFNNFLTQQRPFLTQQEPSDVSKGSYLSLWAATLAVIFVVFSIFGVLKLELTKEDIEKKSDDFKKLHGDIMKLYDILNHLQKISVHFIASSSDNEESRIRRIEAISCILKDLKNDSHGMDTYELLPAIFTMPSIGNSEESKRMELIIRELTANEKGDDSVTIDKALLLGKAYYSLYTSTSQNDKYKQDSLKKSISVYSSILQTYGKDVIDDYLSKKMELPKIIISNNIQRPSEQKNEINDILYDFSRALYDYALNYCDEDLKLFVLKKASDILNNLTK